MAVAETLDARVRGSWRAPLGVRQTRPAPAGLADAGGRARGVRLPRVRVRVRPGRSAAAPQGAPSGGGSHVHAGRADPEPGGPAGHGDRVPGPGRHVADAAGPGRPGAGCGHGGRVGGGGPGPGRRSAPPRAGRRGPRPRRRVPGGIVDPVLHPPGRRLHAAGPVPGDRRRPGRGAADVPAPGRHWRGGHHAGARRRGADGPRGGAIALFRIRRVRGRLVRPVRHGLAAGVPRGRADDRREAGRAVRRYLRPRVRPDRDHRGLRGHAGGLAMDPGGVRMKGPRLSPLRVAAGVALAAWAAVFWFLLLSGRTSLYLSSRTAWVVPTGAIVLTVAAAGRLLTARTPREERLPARMSWALGFVVLPAVIVLALPPTALGSYAASRRSLSAGVASGPALEAGDRVTLAAVAAGTWSDAAGRALIDRAGTTVTFDGIVTRRAGAPADEFVLTRFIVSCCVADALSVQVRVVGAPPGKGPGSAAANTRRSSTSSGSADRSVPGAAPSR